MGKSIETINKEDRERVQGEDDRRPIDFEGGQEGTRDTN